MGGQLAFFGLDGSTGEYLLSARPEEVSAIAQSEQLPGEHQRDVRARAQSGKPALGVADTVEDPSDLAQAGWGVVFAEDADPAIREALSELLRYRAEQAGGRQATYYRELSGGLGYRRGETKRDFLRGRGAPPSGPADPEAMPYYLLLVGSPEAIPYSFQYELDVQYAVGRIHFDTAEEYARYAHSVVVAERANPRPRRVALVGTANPDDGATALSAEHLVTPLAERLRRWQATQDPTGRWAVEAAVGEGATKDRLKRLLGGDDTPALLFTASHGLAFPNGHARQVRDQGALVCQDWPGPLAWRGELPPRFYLAGDDVEDRARPLGLLAFHFACFGAGTPRWDDFPQLAQADGAATGLSEWLAHPIAPHAFVAGLPTRLLGHPGGGALAVVGHVERALGSSFVWSSGTDLRPNLTAFEGALRRLVRGQPVGLAVEAFNERYAELCTDLSQAVRRVTDTGKTADDAELSQLWVGSTDARGYVVLGDPAVRLTGLAAGTASNAHEGG